MRVDTAKTRRISWKRGSAGERERGEGREREDNRQDEGEEREEVVERGSQERRSRAGCYLSHHKAVITFSLPDRSLATLLVAPRSISG